MAFEDFAQQFVGAGGRYVFGVPGGGPSLELITRIESLGGTFIATGHESVSALMAGAHARQTGKPAACVTIKGPGFINLAPGLLCNTYEGYPCLSISEAYALPDTTGRRHKWLDHRSVVGGFVRRISGFDEQQGAVDRLWRQAQSEFPGPVHMDLAPSANTDQAPTPPDPGRAPLDLSWLSKVAGASKPALLLGSWATRCAWRTRLTSLSIPVFTTPSAKGAVPEHLPHCAGVFTGDGSPHTPEKVILPEADLLICLGVRSGEVLSPNPPHSQCLWLDSCDLDTTTLFPDNPLGSSAIRVDDHGIEGLLDALASISWGQDEIQAAFGRLRSVVEDWEDSPLAAMDAVSARLPSAAHIVDTGNFTVWAEHFLRVGTATDLTGTPNGRYLGASLGYAIGTALARAPEPSVLWIGDGGIRAHLGELAIAVDHQLPLLTLVMSDAHFGSIRGRARKLGWSQKPLTLPDHHLKRVAEAMGMAVWTAKSGLALAGILDEWACTGFPPALVEYHLAPETYVDKTEKLR